MSGHGLTHRNPHLAAWVRVGLYAHTHADAAGTVVLEPMQLLKVLDPTMIMQPSSVSRAIRTAVQCGVLREGSTARRLVLVDARGGAP